jgi:hypothetical protein
MSALTPITTKLATRHDGRKGPEVDAVPARFDVCLASEANVRRMNWKVRDRPCEHPRGGKASERINDSSAAPLVSLGVSLLIIGDDINPTGQSKHHASVHNKIEAWVCANLIPILDNTSVRAAVGAVGREARWIIACMRGHGIIL